LKERKRGGCVRKYKEVGSIGDHRGRGVSFGSWAIPPGQGGSEPEGGG